MDSYSLSFLVFLGFFLLTIFIRIKEKTWLSPASLFAMVWLLVMGFSLISAPDYFFSPQALGFIVLLIFIFFCGSMFADFAQRQSKPAILNRTIQKIPDAFFDKFLLMAIVAGLISFVFLIKDSGARFEDLLSREKIMKISAELTNDRYHGIRLSSLTMLFLMLAYSGCFAGGLMLAMAKTLLRRLISFSVLLPILAFTFIYTARAPFIFALLSFAASFLILKATQLKNSLSLLNKKNVIMLLAGVLVIPLLFILTQAARMGVGRLNAESIKMLSDYLRVWFSGNLSAYSIWFNDHDFNLHGAALGQFTFAGLSELAGLGTRELGIYSRAYDVSGHMAFSNIYTIFRFLLDDYGLTGTITCILASGYLCRKLYFRALDGGYTSMAILAGMYALILFSFVTSIFAYNTILFAWFIFVFFCYYFENMHTYDK